MFVRLHVSFTVQYYYTFVVLGVAIVVDVHFFTCLIPVLLNANFPGNDKHTSDHVTLSSMTIDVSAVAGMALNGLQI